MSTLQQFRWIGHAEGISFLVLLFIAMPLKYLAGWPFGVRIVGALHGGLFVLFVVWLIRTAGEEEWSLKRSAGAVLAALLPFGFFVFDARVLRARAVGR